MNLFSVIVANYNNGRFLPDLIRSVQAQTYTNWELIIADDASTDNSMTILMPYLMDHRIKLIRHESNKGAAAAFGTAAAAATGNVIGMLGADDALPPDSIAKMMQAHVDQPNASLINSDSYECDENLNIIRVHPGFRAVRKGERLIDDICVANFATFKKAAYDRTSGFDVTQKKAVDHDIYLKLDEVGDLGYVHEPLYLYRANPAGISQNSNGLRAAQFSIQAKQKAYQRRLGTGKENLSKKQYEQMMKTWFLREAFFYRGNDKKKCNELLKQAIGQFPSLLLRKDTWSILIRNNF